MATLHRKGLVLIAIISGILLAGVAAIGLRESNYSVMTIPARVAAQGKRIPLIGKCREHPIKVSPNQGLAHVVSEEDLVLVLSAALPWWNPLSVPSAFHELKLWGKNADFTRKMLGTQRSGEFLVTTLLSDRACRKNTVRSGGSYLLDSPFGIRPVLLGSDDAIDYRGEAHYGQLLMILGEAGVPGTASVTASSDRIGNIMDIYQDAVMQFSIGHELEFISCALAYWNPPQKTWRNQFGNEYSFDQLLSQLIATQLGKGTCGGCHVPYAVVTILRVDEQFAILSDAVRERARKWLKTLAYYLEYHLSESGGWDNYWGHDSKSKFVMGDVVLDRITITGHHLEWIALAPPDVRPSEMTVRRAVKALRQDVESLPPLHIRSFKSLLPVSHGARALALLRGDDPFSAWINYWKKGRLIRTNKGFEITGLRNEKPT